MQKNNIDLNKKDENDDKDNEQQFSLTVGATIGQKRRQTINLSHMMGS